jgi:FKBP-type peptidyl-prolyl cis-trans isomerase FkpA
MKLTLFTLLLFSAIYFVSCRKSGNNIDIKQYDQQQIQSYIASNGITGMQRDLTNGDTTGIYYQIINPGDPTKPVDYPDTISYVYTLRTFDGKFTATDTVLDHYNGFLGHVVPNGLQLSIRNLLKYKGGKMRVLIPSHLAYGTNGIHTGSTTVANNNIGGNQCIDYTINLISDQIAYDDLVIKNYMAANNLSGYSKTTDGLYYKIITHGTGNPINNNSSVTCNYYLQLMNNTYADSTAKTTVSIPFNDLGNTANIRPGFSEGLKLIAGQGAISLILPSRLGYGTSVAGAIPANACLRFEIYNVAVINY